MGTKKIRLAFLGVGMRGQYLAGLYQNHKDIEIVAAADFACDRASSFTAQFNAEYGTSAKAFKSWEDMKKGAAFDAVMITVSPFDQVDYACDAMENGIHVMTEVPCTMKLDDCFKLVHTVEKTGCKYQLNEQTRYWNFIREWRKMSERGEFGKIIYAEGEYMHYEPAWDNFIKKATGESVWSNDPSLYNNPEYEISWRGTFAQHPIWYLPHTLSPLLSVTGGRIERVSCVGTRLGSYVAEGMRARDIETAVMHCSGDVVYNVRASFFAPHGNRMGTHAHWYQVKGTKCSVEWARSAIDTPKKWTLEDGWSAPEWGLEDPEADEFIRRSGHGGADFYPLYYFVDALQNDKTPPMDVYRAVESAAPAIMAAKSSEMNGAMLEVPDFRCLK